MTPAGVGRCDAAE